MDTSIPGSGTDFGASITSFVLSFPPQLHGRYKNRLQLGPEARCVGVDMNRYAQDPNYLSNVFINGQS